MMRLLIPFTCGLASLLLSQACVRNVNNDESKNGTLNDSSLVFVKGGSFKNIHSNLYGKTVEIPDFYIGRYEITQREWKEVMQSNPSRFIGDNLPVETVSWYDCIEYCNKRSLKEGLKPYYNIRRDVRDPANVSEFDSVKWTVTFNERANGYRLPTEAEWEYAASGGQASKSYVYSGGAEIDHAAWYWRNSGDSALAGTWTWMVVEKNKCRTQPVGTKEPNELGLYDMSGNVREWCEDWYEDFETGDGIVRVQRGGGWMGSEVRCEIFNRHSFEASGKGPDQGFRVCRSAN